MRSCALDAQAAQYVQDSKPQGPGCSKLRGCWLHDCAGEGVSAVPSKESGVTLQGVLGLDVDLLHSRPAGPGLHKHLLHRREPSETRCCMGVIYSLGYHGSVTEQLDAVRCPALSFMAAMQQGRDNFAMASF